MMLIRVPLQSVAAVAASAGVPPSPAHRLIAYIDGSDAALDKTSQSAAAAAAAAAAASSIKVGRSHNS